MIDTLKNIWYSYTTNQGFFWVTLFGVMLIVAGAFNIRVLMKVFTIWKLWIYELPNNVKRIILIVDGLIIVVAMIMTAAQQ